MKNNKLKLIVALIVCIVVVGLITPNVISRVRKKAEGNIATVTSVIATTVSLTTTTVKDDTEETEETDIAEGEESTKSKEINDNENKKDKYLNDCLGTFWVTGYYESEGFPYGSPTASGKTGCKPGICAMNRFEMQELCISYGDYIYVEGLGDFQVMDCTADYITNTVDIWVYTKSEADALTGYYDIYRLGE